MPCVIIKFAWKKTSCISPVNNALSSYFEIQTLSKIKLRRSTKLYASEILIYIWNKNAWRN